jgi:hypothetical protein
MEPRYLWTIRWTQPYATNWQRPYLRGLQEQMEQAIENLLESGDFSIANQVINKIKEMK